MKVLYKRRVGGGMQEVGRLCVVYLFGVLCVNTVLLSLYKIAYANIRCSTNLQVFIPSLLATYNALPEVRLGQTSGKSRDSGCQVKDASMKRLAVFAEGPKLPLRAIFGAIGATRPLHSERFAQTLGQLLGHAVLAPFGLLQIS